MNKCINQGYFEENQNFLLSILPDEEIKRILPHLHLVNLSKGKYLSNSGDKASYVYFPTSATFSIIKNLENGTFVEIAIIGDDGMIGDSCFWGGVSTLNRAIVQNSGKSYKIDTRYIKAEFNKSTIFRDILLKYNMALVAQISQNVVCNKYHRVEQQFCRWILMHIDRLHSNEIIMTQELISNLLGVRREAISVAAENLQKAGLISYHRGHIKILDRVGIEERSCECYETLKKDITKIFENTN